MKYFYAPSFFGSGLTLLGKEQGGQIVSALPYLLVGVYSPHYDNGQFVVFTPQSFEGLSGWIEKTRDEVFSDFPFLFLKTVTSSGEGFSVTQLNGQNTPYYSSPSESETSVYEVQSSVPFSFHLPELSNGLMVVVKAGPLCGPSNPVNIIAGNQQEIDGGQDYTMTFPRSSITCASTASGWIII